MKCRVRPNVVRFSGICILGTYVVGKIGFGLHVPRTWKQSNHAALQGGLGVTGY